MNTTKTAGKLRKRIGRFSGDLSKGLCKRAQAFVAQMLYGIQASESVLLTEIGRTLHENIPLRKTQWRLSRNLQRAELEKTVQENLLCLAADRINHDSLLIIDPSDLSKKYAQKMEFLTRIRDGSAHDLANGYSTLHVIGAQVDSKNIVPLYQRLWSSAAPGFVSENEEILRAVDAVRAHIPQRGLWVMDRGGDRINLFGPLLDRHERFLFRLVGNRNLRYRGKTLLAQVVAQGCRCPHTKTIVRMEHDKERAYALRFGFCNVKLPEREEPLYLLVIHGIGQEPLMLLTNEPLQASFKSQWRMVRSYFQRWSIEETIRYIKTCYDLENVRVLNYQALRNLMPLLLAVMFFLSCVLDRDQRLRIMAHCVEKAAKRLFGIPDFKYYALADGLQALFANHPGKPNIRPRAPTPSQLDLWQSQTP